MTESRQEVMEFVFNHGLGDCANACQVLALHHSRGNRIRVKCTPEKEIIFKHAGCEFIHHNTPVQHPWLHAPTPRVGSSAWRDNKTGFNMTQFPTILAGNIDDNWNELCNFQMPPLPVDEKIYDFLNSYLAPFSKPIILLHPFGNTGRQAKDISPQLYEETVNSLLDGCGGTVIVLDWDNRIKLTTKAKRICSELKHLDLSELYALINICDLFIGVDSGPLHFSRWVNHTKVIGLWVHNHPAVFSLPHFNSCHLVLGTGCDSGLTHRRMQEFNIVPCLDSGIAIANQAQRILNDCSSSSKLYETLLDKQIHDRKTSFSMFLDRCSNAEIHPIIVETGSIRKSWDWGAGFFGYLCGVYLRQNGGWLHTLEIDKLKCEFARTWTSCMPVTTHHTDSRIWLKDFCGMISGLYCDSADVGTENYQDICLQEVQAALPNMLPTGAILIDDTGFVNNTWTGKGAKAIPYLLGLGWQVKFTGHATLLTFLD